jgi:small GTP-binding protein
MSVFKVVLLGTTDVGKTSLFLRMSENLFDPFSQTTILGSSKLINIEREGAVRSFVLHDTAGQERYRSMTMQYVRGACIGLIVFSIIAKQSFLESQAMAQNVQTQFPNISLFLIGNKSDLEDTREVARQDASDAAERIGGPYVETSAMTGEGFDELLTLIAAELASRKRKEPAVNTGVVNLENDRTTGRKRGCC